MILEWRPWELHIEAYNSRHFVRTSAVTNQKCINTRLKCVLSIICYIYMYILYAKGQKAEIELRRCLIHLTFKTCRVSDSVSLLRCPGHEFTFHLWASFSCSTNTTRGNSSSSFKGADVVALVVKDDEACMYIYIQHVISKIYVMEIVQWHCTCSCVLSHVNTRTVNCIASFL